jgi:hypothetical protein
MRTDPARKGEPLSTHASMQMLVRPNVQPRVEVKVATGPDAGYAEGTMFLTVEAQHRAQDFDHSASFTVSGPPAAVDRLLLAMRAAYASYQEPDAPPACE